MKKWMYIVSGIILLATESRAQRDVDPLLDTLIKYAAAHPREKVFVHTDKSFYISGEICRFKVYCADAQRNTPSSLSKVVYVELMGSGGGPVWQGKIGLNESGSGNGSLQFPYAWASGSYRLRAYTQWMRNDAADDFFEKSIDLVNPLRKQDSNADSTRREADLQFFPEGGQMIAGIETRIGFKITAPDGKGMDAHGAILNSRNDTVLKIATLRSGMGHFDWLPDAGETYRAELVPANGTRLIKTLPAPAYAGIGLRLIKTGAATWKLIIRSKQAGNKISVLIHNRQIPRLAVSRELFNGETEIELNAAELGEGISQILVFDAAGKPVAERLVFRKPSGLHCDFVTDSAEYHTRSLIQMQLQTAETIDGSVSVYPLDALQQLPGEDILSYFWLQSDLRGKIESPGFYFDSSSMAAEAADNLMLTQGWRKWNWKDIAAAKELSASAFLPEPEGHLVQGRVVNRKTGQPAAGITVYLSIPSARPVFNTAKSDSNGQIVFLLKNFYGGNELMLQVKKGEDSIFRVDINTPFAEHPAAVAYQQVKLRLADTALLEMHNLQTQVQNAYEAERMRQFRLPEKLDTVLFYGKPDAHYLLDEYTRFLTLEEVFREYVFEVKLLKQDNRFVFRTWNPSYKTYSAAAPLVLLDGVPQFDADQVLKIDPLKLKKIDVITHRFYQQEQAYDGVIHLQTYAGDLAGRELDPDILVMDYEGLQLEREFYTPVYETQEQRQSPLPDFRNTLYWNPSVLAEKGQTVKLRFYTSDMKGRYAAVLQALGADGKAANRILYFTVK